MRSPILVFMLVYLAVAGMGSNLLFSKDACLVAKMALLDTDLAVAWFSSRMSILDSQTDTDPLRKLQLVFID